MSNTTHTKKYILCIFQKYFGKAIIQMDGCEKSNEIPEEGENIISRVTTLQFSKCPVLSKKLPNIQIGKSNSFKGKREFELPNGSSDIGIISQRH